MGVEIMMNKKGLIFKNAYFAVIAVSMVIIAVGVIVGEWNTAYDSGLTYDLDEYNQLDSISGNINETRGTVSAQDGSDGDSEGEGSVLRAVFGVITGVFKPFRVVFGSGGMLDSISDRFQIPQYVTYGIITLMITSMIWAVIAIVFRTGRTTT